MIIAKRLKGKAIATWLGPTGDAARKAVSKVRQKITSTPNKLSLYFDISDPWSHVTAQAFERLVQAYPIEYEVTMITPPAADVDPAPTLRPKHAVRDCQQLAAYWNVDFPGKKEADAGSVRDVGATLVKKRPPAEQLRAAIELTGAMWANDKKQIVALMGKWGVESHGEILPILNTAYSELRKAGHYQGGMIHYAGTWYWGIDRLPYLEAALAANLGREIAHVVVPRAQAERGAQALTDKPAPLTCELWFSFRSPYSYLALEQIEAVLAPYQIPLVLRPLAPMVARGLPLPQVKRLYIVRDAKREADRLGISFGELCDPLGAGVDNCLAIAHWAAKRGGGADLAFAKSAMRGIWSEARDVAEYLDLRHLVERA
nr:DsbA family protein [Deltaproteobacteria bacterium]